jgi:AAA domain
MKFTPSAEIIPKLKILIYGPPKSGKTLAALSFPRPVLVDSEGGADLYGQRADVAPFGVLKTASLTELSAAVDEVKRDQGVSFDTLIIDSLTVFTDLLRAERADAAGMLGYRERASINVLMGGLYAKLAALPVHLVVIAHETSEYRTEGRNLTRAGDKAHADTSINYRFDFILQTKHDFSAVVVESRGYPAKGEIIKPNWSVFEPAIRADDLRNKDVARAFFARWQGQGLTQTDILEALGVPKASAWQNGLSAAEAAVQAWVTARNGVKL